MTRWYVREATKRGGIHPPRTSINRGYEPSSAMRRQENRIHDRQILADYVQLKPGVLVVWDRKPHRIIELAERPLDLWGDKHEMRYATALERWERLGQRGDRPEKATWDGRPYVFVLQPDGKPHEKPLHLIGPADHSWDVLPEHYAICSACDELPPCTHELAEREADRQATRFPGPNLWRLDLPDNSAVFHARNECSTPREKYREQWEARGGMKQPSLFADEEKAS